MKQQNKSHHHHHHHHHHHQQQQLKQQQWQQTIKLCIEKSIFYFFCTFHKTNDFAPMF